MGYVSFREGKCAGVSCFFLQDTLNPQDIFLTEIGNEKDWSHVPAGCVAKMGVEPKMGGKPPKMDGENHGTSYDKMDDLGGKPTI